MPRILSTRLAESEALRGRAESDLARLKEQFLRLRADLENLRKRGQKEKEDLRKFANQAFVEALIPVLDSFDQSHAALNSTHDVEALARGFESIRQQLENVLKSQGFERVDAAGQVFDPNFHEALAVIPSGEHPEDTVVDVLQNGYLLNGRLVRPARVRIAQRPAEAARRDKDPR